MISESENMVGRDCAMQSIELDIMSNVFFLYCCCIVEMLREARQLNHEMAQILNMFQIILHFAGTSHVGANN